MERPRSLVLAAALIAVQALGLAVWGAVVAVRASVGHPHDRGTAISLAVLVVVLALGVGLAARGLWRAQRWAQAPSYLVSFFAVVIGLGQVNHLPALMVPWIVIGIASFVALSLPDSRSALGGI